MSKANFDPRDRADARQFLDRFDGKRWTYKAGDMGRLRSFSQAEALTVFGPDATPYAVKRRLRCSACAEVGHVEVWI